MTNLVGSTRLEGRVMRRVHSLAAQTQSSSSNSGCRALLRRYANLLAGEKDGERRDDKRMSRCLYVVYRQIVIRLYRQTVVKVFERYFEWNKRKLL